jgi:hypothetical protein
MSELVLAGSPRPSPASARLVRATASLARRLAGLLADVGVPGTGQLADGRVFLEAMAAAATGPEPPVAGADPLDRLVDALGLSRFEVDALLLAGLAEEHEGYASVLRALHPRGEPFATVGLAAQLLCRDAEERALLRDTLARGAAVRAGALRAPGDDPFFERSLRPAPGLWPVLHEIDTWPQELAPLDGPVAAAGLEGWLAAPGATRAARTLGVGAAATVLITADHEDVALARAAALAAHAGVRFARLSFPSPAPRDLERLASVHALARGVVPLVRVGRPEAPATALLPGFAGHPGPVVLCAPAGFASLDTARPVVPVPVYPLGPAERRRMWRATLPRLAAQAPVLAARHPLEPGAAAEVAADLRAVEFLERRPATVADAAESVRARAGGMLGAGIKLLRPTASWDLLVLAPERREQLVEAADRLREQARVLDEWGFLAGRPGARGVRMLFAGPPGTGKTLSAEVLAHTLGVDLLLVDISRVLSKWIGETEKNLAAVFDAAERAQAVLFFDEADALFGKRTEVSDAHDRYANLETAYLLTRLERFEGLAILSTNLRQNIDSAFTRRIEFVLEFAEPTTAEREALWRCHLPPGAPLADDVDLAELSALYPIVGALIRNASVAAAFLAAAEDAPIRRDHLVRSIRREYDKAGRAFPAVPAAASIP